MSAKKKQTVSIEERVSNLMLQMETLTMAMEMQHKRILRLENMFDTMTRETARTLVRIDGELRDMKIDSHAAPPAKEKGWYEAHCDASVWNTNPRIPVCVATFYGVFREVKAREYCDWLNSKSL
jgi:hypothetical protein